MTSSVGRASGATRYARRVLPALLVAAALAVPLLTTSPLQLGRLELVLIYLLGAISLNFAFGFGGQLAIAQPFLIMVSAYAAAIASTRWGVGILVSAPLGILAAVGVSALLGLPSLRVRGWYLAIIGLLAVGIIPSLAEALPDLTGGDNGISRIPPIGVAGAIASPGAVYEIMLVATVLCWVAVRNLAESGWGIALQAGRDHPIAAAACGVSNVRMRAWVYVLSAIPCGLAGVLFAHSQQFVSADNFGTTTILLLIGSVFLGGPGTLWGPVLGVAIFEGLALYLGEFSPYNPLAFGLGVLAAALLFRGGIIRNLEMARQRFRPQSRPAVRLGPPTSDQGGLDALGRVPLFSVDGIEKHFGGNRVLNGISLDVRGGELVGVVGPNGSGKTTLLNVIGGFVAPDAGAVTLDGRDITRQAPHRRATEGVGRTFQVPKLMLGMSILKNVELGVVGIRTPAVASTLFRWAGFRAAERRRRERARAACLAVGFQETELDLQVGTLPLGLRRMVEIARALAGGTELLCLDESVAGLDEHEQGQVARIARAFADSGRAVLLIEHNLPFVRAVCDRLVLLEGGRLVDGGPPEVAGDVTRPLGRYFQTFAAEPARPA